MKILLLRYYLLEVLLNVLKLQKLKQLRRNVIVRRWWVKPHLHTHLRDTLGGYELIFEYFRHENEEEFYNLVGIPVRLFNDLILLIQGRLLKFNSRKTLSPELKVATTLSFLRQGGNTKFVALFYRIGESTIFEVIKEVCSVLKEVLLPLQFPRLNRRKWLQISSQYERLWNMLHCIGAIDGRHFRIRKPDNSSSLFYNYKQFFSLVLLATCDAYKRFTWFNLGNFGSVNDARIFNNSDLYRKIVNKELEIPEEVDLPDSNVKMPYFFIGDKIFALQKHLLIPFPKGNNLEYVHKVYNYRIKRARLTMKNAFGILTKKWAFLQQSHAFKLNTMEDIIVSLMCLHNMTITANMKNIDNENDENLIHILDQRAKQAVLENQDIVNMTGIAQRNCLAQLYFLSEAGSVPWQDSYI